MTTRRPAEKETSAVREARLLFFVTRPIKFVFCNVVFAVHVVSAKAPLMSLARLSSCVMILPPHPYSTYIQKCAHATTKSAKWSKSPTRLCIALMAILTIYFNVNNKTRGASLQAANMANLTKMVNLANKFVVNLANVANSPTLPATSTSMQMIRQMKKHRNCEFQQKKLILFVLLYSYLFHI